MVKNVAIVEGIMTNNKSASVLAVDIPALGRTPEIVNYIIFDENELLAPKIRSLRP